MADENAHSKPEKLVLSAQLSVALKKPRNRQSRWC